MENTQRKKYKKDFLDNVIVRIDFDSPLPIENTGPAKGIYKAVSKRFPITEEKKVIGKQLLISRDSTQEREIETNEWHYFGKNREKHLFVSPNIMFIEYKKYEYYEHLREDFLSVFKELCEGYPKLQIKRLGLRYIDIIKLQEENPTVWEKYFKKELTSIFNLAANRNGIARAFHIIEFNYNEEILRFQFGMFNPDYPAPIRKKEYTLDFDMYVNKLVDNLEIETLLDRFHIKLNSTFEEVITDELRLIMEPVNG